MSNSEIKKIKITWKREDAIAISADIAELTKLVYDFTTCQNDSFRVPAISKAAEMRSKATGAIAKTLDDLHVALSQCNRYKSEQILSELIKQNPDENQRKQKHKKNT